MNDLDYWHPISIVGEISTTFRFKDMAKLIYQNLIFENTPGTPNIQFQYPINDQSEDIKDCS